MECKYCKKVLSSLSSLNLHQKNTKYCLVIQGKLGNKKNKDNKCKFCYKFFSTNNNLNRHYVICSNNTLLVKELNEKVRNYEVEIKMFNEKVKMLNEKVKTLEEDKKELQKSYQALASLSVSRPTTATTNNTTHNTLNLSVFDKTQADIKRIVNEKYDKEYLKAGQKGVAQFTTKHIINSEESKFPLYVITDKSRGNGKYRKSNAEVVTDNKMTGLTRKVYPSIKERAIDIANKEDAIRHPELMDGYREVYEMSEDNTIFRNEMVRELSKDILLTTSTLLLPLQNDPNIPLCN
jgi:hypothetical protein